MYVFCGIDKLTKITAVGTRGRNPAGKRSQRDLRQFGVPDAGPDINEISPRSDNDLTKISPRFL
jgi:hypothetical protein